MPENEQLLNTSWLVGVVGHDEELLIHAAYVVYHNATSGSAARPGDLIMATLKNEAHKAVFQVPAAMLAYVRRADITARVDRDAPRTGCAT